MSWRSQKVWNVHATPSPNRHLANSAHHWSAGFLFPTEIANGAVNSQHKPFVVTNQEGKSTAIDRTSSCGYRCGKRDGPCIGERTARRRSCWRSIAAEVCCLLDFDNKELGWMLSIPFAIAEGSKRLQFSWCADSTERFSVSKLLFQTSGGLRVDCLARPMCVTRHWVSWKKACTDQSLLTSTSDLSWQLSQKINALSKKSDQQNCRR